MVERFAGLSVYVLYAVVQCVLLQPEPYFGGYDSGSWAKAITWFLLKRLGLTPSQATESTPGTGSAMFNSTHLSNVHNGRHVVNKGRLPQGTSGESYSPCMRPALTGVRPALTALCLRQ